MLRCCEKRINNEIKIFETTKYSPEYNKNIINFFETINIGLCYNNNENLIIIKSNEQTILELKIPNDYPFKPFLVVRHDFSNRNYSQFLNELKTKLYKNNINFDIIKFFYKIKYSKESLFLNLNEKECFCCNSLNCSGNWCPKFTIISFLLEYLEIRFINYYANITEYKKIEDIYKKIFNEKISDDIKELIFSFL